MDDPNSTDGIPPEPLAQPSAPKPKEKLARSPRVVLLGATALISSAALYQAPTLWNEVQGLRDDWERTRLNSPIGYIEIAPSPSFAQPPDPWAVTEGDTLLLWSNWVDGVGHHWYRFDRSHLDPSQLTIPLGRDYARAIDKAYVEKGGGTLWDRHLPETSVVGLELQSTATAYPMLLLSKVEVVNDTIDGVPILTVFTPFVPEDEAVDFFDPRLDGTRIRLGCSGYFLNSGTSIPLLCDRDTESFWLARDHRLVCVAGARKGAELRNLGRGRPSAWSDWVARHPDSRLVIGADRGATPPAAISALPAGPGAPDSPD